MNEITKMTTKGQVVIPSGIRKELGLDEGSQLAVSKLGNLVVMKKVALPNLKKELDRVTKWGSAVARRAGIKSEEEVVDRIHQFRKRQRSQNSV